MGARRRCARRRRAPLPPRRSRSPSTSAPATQASTPRTPSRRRPPWLHDRPWLPARPWDLRRGRPSPCRRARPKTLYTGQCARPDALARHVVHAMSPYATLGAQGARRPAAHARAQPARLHRDAAQAGHARCRVVPGRPPAHGRVTHGQRQIMSRGVGSRVISHRGTDWDTN